VFSAVSSESVRTERDRDSRRVSEATLVSNNRFPVRKKERKKDLRVKKDRYKMNEVQKGDGE